MIVICAIAKSAKQREEEGKEKKKEIKKAKPCSNAVQSQYLHYFFTVSPPLLNQHCKRFGYFVSLSTRLTAQPLSEGQDYSNWYQTVEVSHV